MVSSLTVSERYLEASSIVYLQTLAISLLRNNIYDQLKYLINVAMPQTEIVAKDSLSTSNKMATARN
jgi:hypothetical protein